MGCSGIDVRESGLKILNAQNLEDMDLDLKNSLILYLSPKIPKYIKTGIYVDTIYHKAKGVEKIIKYTKRKFLLKNDTKKSFNKEQILNKFLEDFPQFIKNDEISKNKINKFYTLNLNFLLTDNYTNLFKSFNIETNNKINFAICFINENLNESNLSKELQLIKEENKDTFFIYKIENETDKYSLFEHYTLFFKENKINFWIENDCYNNNCFKFLLNYNKALNNINNNIINTAYIINNDTIKNYLNIHSKKNDEYIIKNKYYEFYDNDGNVIEFNEFPTYIITSNHNEHFNEQIVMITSKNNINIINFIIDEIKKINSNINVEKIEIFKERITSFIIRNYFISKKRYSLFFSCMDKEIFFNLIKEIQEKINPSLKQINNSFSIENIIVLPKTNSKFNFYEENKQVYIIINYSTCIKFVKNYLKSKYEDIYGKDKIKLLCIINDNDDVDLDNLIDNNDIIFINKKLIFRDNKYIDFFIYSFNPTNYFSHILLIVNEERIIQYANYFKNRASVFYEYLGKEKLNIKQNLPLIEANNFKNVKKFFVDKMKVVLNNVQIGQNDNIIDFDDDNIFENFYKNDIIYQPYLSLKYNKIININKKSEKYYKNYSLNYINFKNKMEINFDENEHKPLNEISHIYYEKENYITIKKELRCKECFSKLNNKKKYVFYFCPISKAAICEQCYKKDDTYQIGYPFNLLYINCRNKKIFENLPKDNILLFRDGIKSENHPEILDEICDICSKNLCNKDDKGYSFYVLINIIRKNNFLICNNCFEILNDDKRSWNFNNKYNFINELTLYNFIDLDNLIFKKVILI